MRLTMFDKKATFTRVLRPIIALSSVCTTASFARRPRRRALPSSNAARPPGTSWVATTASGEKANPHGMTAAHLTLPFRDAWWM